MISLFLPDLNHYHEILDVITVLRQRRHDYKIYINGKYTEEMTTLSRKGDTNVETNTEATQEHDGSGHEPTK